LPKFQCNRCLEEFKKKEELSKHQRAATSCHLKEVEAKTSPRDIADGYDKAQEEKLSKRSRNKPGHEKWAEWYCILFNLDPATAEIPSPCKLIIVQPRTSLILDRAGYGVNDGEDWRQGHSDRSKYGEWADWMRQELPPRLRIYIEAEVDRAMDGVEQKLRSTVVNRVRGMTLSLHRIFQAIPPPPETSSSPKIQDLAGTFDVPPNLYPGDFFADCGAEIDQAIGPDNQFGDFDFSFDVGGVDLEPSSTSSCSSDSNFLATTSDSSVEDENIFTKHFRPDITNTSSAPVVYSEFPISFVDHNSSYEPIYGPNDG
jgi:hypothetical protein